MKVGLFFGSFNPIHIGHLIVADSMLHAAVLDEVWLIVSPQNPFKKQTELADDLKRLAMVELSLSDHPKLKSNNVEFKLSKPSYTIHTLDALKEQFPEVCFSIIMGSDNLIYFEKWKEYNKILELVEIDVYARETEISIPEKWQNHKKITLHPMPLIHVSSTFIRNKIKKDESIRYWVKEEVRTYIIEHQLYQ